MAEKRSAAATAAPGVAGEPGCSLPDDPRAAGEPGCALPEDPGVASEPGCAITGEPLCPFFHEAVELVGRRWTGVILRALMDGPLRFSEVAAAIPELSDRLLSERMKELEARGLVRREVLPGRPPRVRYSLSEMGRDLEPALGELQRWARRWLSPPGRA
jgi:DNA-binding HxlR family transcriptional regulator